MLSKDEVLKFVRGLEPHSHVIAFYENPEDKRDLLYTYLMSGIEKGYAGAYVAGEETPDEVREHMKEYGIDVDKLEKEKALRIINYDGWYIVNGKVDPQHTISLWIKLLEESRRLGYKSLRACGEMTVFFRKGLIKELIRYEESLHRRLELAMMGLCAYNARDFTGGLEHVMIRLIASHEYLIVMGPVKTITVVKA